MRLCWRPGARITALFLIGVLFCVQFADAQQVPVVQRTGAIDFTVDPKVVPAGTPAKIAGTLPLSGAPLTVAVNVTSPTRQAFSLSGRTNTKGEFSILFPQTRAVGEYQVSVVAEGGRGGASTSFEVMALAVIIEAVKRESEQILAAAKTLNEAALQSSTLVRDSPAKQELKSRITRLDQLLKRGASWDAGPEGVRALDDLRSAIEANPGSLPMFGPAFAWMINWTENARSLREKMLTLARKKADAIPHKTASQTPFHVINTRAMPFSAGWVSRLAESRSPSGQMSTGVSMHRADSCAAMNDAPEVLEFASTLMNLWSEPWEIALNLITGVAASQLSFSGGQALKFGVAKVQQWLRGRKSIGDEYKTDLALDVTKALSEKVFESGCGRLVGPMHGSMHAEGSYNGRPWWKYDIELEGRTVLIYSKSDVGVAIPVNGYFEGQGTKFHVWEDAFRVLGRKLGDFTLANEGLGRHKITATSLDALLAARSPARTANTFSTLVPAEDTSYFAYTPLGLGGYVGNRFGLAAAYFKVIIYGTLQSDRFTFYIANSIADFDDTLISAPVKYWVPSAGSVGLLPVFQVLGFRLPYKNAYFILGRATVNRARTVKLHFSPYLGNIISTEFRNEHGAGIIPDPNDPGLRGQASYYLKMEGCQNPECPDGSSLHPDIPIN